MPSKAIATSPAIGRMLKERREALGLTLRAVASLSGERGHPIPYSTLARVEAGRLDPGVRRLQQLLRLYDLPSQVAGDLIDLEDLAGAIPFERDPAKLKKRALAAWHRGDVSEALACFLAFRDRTARTGELRDMRHEAIVSFAIAASSLGKHQLARHMLDALLLERPGPNVLVSLLVQQSVVWDALGSTEAALAFLDRVRPTSRRVGSTISAGWWRSPRVIGARRASSSGSPSGRTCGPMRSTIRRSF
jgi:transcriptional regulator with XRE-family HTH domain